MNPDSSVAKIFVYGSEGKKWFNINSEYIFTKEAKNEDDYSYNTILTVELNQPLRDWFADYLIYEKIPPGKTTLEQKDHLKFNG